MANGGNGGEMDQIKVRCGGWRQTTALTHLVPIPQLMLTDVSLVGPPSPFYD